MRLPRRAAVGWIFACTALTARDERRRPRRRGHDALAHRDDARHRLHDVRVPAAHASSTPTCAPRATRSRGCAVAEERAALRARPARPARPQPVGHRAEGRARRAARCRRPGDAPPSTSTDIENVARDALGEVREAVSGYRRPTLVDELAGARMALRRRGHRRRPASAPTSRCRPTSRRVLAWTVREGTTNVIRHSGARSCRIAVQPGLGDGERRGRRRRRARAGDDDDARRRQRPRRPARARRAARRPRRGRARARGRLPAARHACRCSGPRRDPDPHRRGPGDGPRGARQPARARGRPRASSPRSAAATRCSRPRARAEPDVALLDIEMPGATGLEVAARARRASVPDCRVLILTTFGRPGYLRRAMEGGAAGFLLKDAPAARARRRRSAARWPASGRRPRPRRRRAQRGRRAR